jgi:hypothetical protein
MTVLVVMTPYQTHKFKSNQRKYTAVSANTRSNNTHHSISDENHDIAKGKFMLVKKKLTKERSNPPPPPKDEEEEEGGGGGGGGEGKEEKNLRNQN